MNNLEKLQTSGSGQVEAFLLAFWFPGERLSGAKVFLSANHHLMGFWAKVEKAVIQSFRAIVVRFGVVIVLLADDAVC